MPLLVLSELQQFLVLFSMAFMAIIGRATPWASTYRRLALGMLVSFVTLTLSNFDIWQGAYRTAFVYDFTLILPFVFYPWAAPPEPLDGFRDLSTSVTIVSALPLLMARLAVERSDRQQADSRLRLMAAATEQADDLIFILQQNGRFQYANAAFCRHVGYSLAELGAVAFGDVLEGESARQADAILDTLRAGTSWHGTLTRQRRDGSTFPVSSTIVPLSDIPVGVGHFVGVERNVTEDLRLREQLIHSERLSAAGQLVSGVAHELNNPLQSIVTFSDLLIESERRTETRRDLQQIHNEAKRAGKIVRNLLTFVRRSASQHTTADLNDIVRRTVALRAYELTMASITVEERYASQLPPVAVNREEIQ